MISVIDSNSINNKKPPYIGHYIDSYFFIKFDKRQWHEGHL